MPKIAPIIIVELMNGQLTLVLGGYSVYLGLELKTKKKEMSSLPQTLATDSSPLLISDV